MRRWSSIVSPLSADAGFVLLFDAGYEEIIGMLGSRLLDAADSKYLSCIADPSLVAIEPLSPP